MKISSCSILSDCQEKDIRELMALCVEYEPVTMTFPMTNENNCNQKRDCYYLLYEGKTLINATALYMPNEETCEIMGFTHPKYRMQGAFSLILEKIEEDFAGNKDVTFIFVTDGNSKDAEKSLQALESTFWYSEYMLELDLVSDQWKKHITGDTELSVIVEESIGLDQKESEITYYSCLGNNKVGRCKILLFSSYAYLYGLSIVKNMRNQGYGTEFLDFILKDLKKRCITKAKLQVNSYNQIALHLYYVFGFTISGQMDYFLW